MSSRKSNRNRPVPKEETAPDRPAGSSDASQEAISAGSAKAEVRLACIETRMEAIERAQQDILRLLRAALGQLADPGTKRAGGATAVADLTSTQQEVFQAIAQIEGTTQQARVAVERLLSHLTGEPVTKALVSSLKTELKTRCWGIVCSCGAAAAPVWQAVGGLPQLVASGRVAGQGIGAR